MRPQPTVRPALAADYDAWRPLWDGYNAFYGRHGDTALPEAVTAATWARFLDPREPMQGLVAEGEHGLLGLAHLVFHPSTTMASPTCYLQDLFTAAEARGCGIGRALIAAAVEAARSGGSSRLYWHTHETNAQALQLYDAVAERSGFILYRIDPAHQHD